MQLENTFTVPAPVDDAWRVLLHVERVAPCMPGATVDSVDGDQVKGRVKVKVGPIVVTYRGTARFAQRDEAAHTLVLEASGREARGSGTANATVRAVFEPDGEGTRVTVTTDLAVTGRPAQFGRGVMAEVSAKLIDQFAACLADEVRGGMAAAPSYDDTAAAPSAAAATPTDAVSTDSGPAPAAPPLPPAGAPQEPAAAPATPVAAAATPATPVTSAPRRPTDDAIDLLGTAGAPVLRRVAPALAAVVAALTVLLVVRRLRRRD